MKRYLDKISLLYNTIKYLKAKQLFYQLYYRFSPGRFRLKDYSGSVESLNLLKTKYPYGKVVFSENAFSFTFLNRSKTFAQAIDWNFSEYGKLWTFNLNYFDFLTDDDFFDDKKQSLILDYTHQFDTCILGKASYTISLRGYNWIKYITQSNWKDKNVISHLYSQYRLLYSRFEYHILANHLLENAISLMFAAYFFNDETFCSKARKELEKELEEQICQDGCHYERSIMYHCILLGRLIELVYLVKNNSTFTNQSFNDYLEAKVALMLGFLSRIKFSEEEIPMFNDAIRGTFPLPSCLFELAKSAEINYKESALSDSGYRKVEKRRYSVVVDVDGIFPSYQPGHAHADSLSFELYCNHKPLIVDVGTSTYEADSMRQYERSTMAHNTVSVGDKNQSQVWGGFRVAKRAKVDLEQSQDQIIGCVRAYDKSSLHKRNFLFQENEIIISDVVESKKQVLSTARLYLHPYCSVEKLDINNFKIDGVLFSIDGAQSIKLEDYKYASSFNMRKDAICIVVDFIQEMTTRILFLEKP